MMKSTAYTHYGDDFPNWNGKFKVAALFAVGHLVILVLPFFSAIFLLMDVVEDESYFQTNNHRLMSGILLILLIVTLFSELITMFSKAFTKFVIGEVVILASFIFLNGYFPLLILPLIIIISCTITKICCALYSERVEQAKNNIMKQCTRPGKTV